MISLSYSGFWLESFTESGAGVLNLHVDSQNANSFQSGAGAKLGVIPIQWGDVTVAPRFRATYQHEFADGRRNINARLIQGGNSFVFRTDAAPNDYVWLNAEVSLFTDTHFQFQFNANAEAWR